MIFLKYFCNKNFLRYNSLLHNHQEIYATNFKFVPKFQNLTQKELNKFKDFINNSTKLFVLSGAGLSTESGIPDYRSEKVGLYSTTKHRPITHSEFMNVPNRRKAYWARNFVSWPIFREFKPNIAHLIFSKWEKKRIVHHHVTQNVDSLLTKAGCLKLTELHGSSNKVKCMDCGFSISRDSMQDLIEMQNPYWIVKAKEILPDNDIKLTDEQIKNFEIPICPNCNKNRLKPELIFFGDSIPKNIVELTFEKLKESDSLLAVGTSLETYSAYRLILNAKDLKIPICILNIGKTRGDSFADLKINSICSQTLKNAAI